MTDPLEELFERIAEAEPDAARPFVTLTYAQSLDGSIAALPGRPLALSGPAALGMTHRLRAMHAAILVGIKTVLADDPQLNVRHFEGEDPRPVVLDTYLNLPLNAKLLENAPLPWVAAAEEADPARRHRLEETGVRVLSLPLNDLGFIDLVPLLARLRQDGIRRVMVEGGGQVIHSFLACELVDLLVITLCPLLVGGVPALSDPAFTDAGRHPRLRRPTWVPVGEDLVVWGELEWRLA